jgi:RNA ligase (TIGR02306 family)
MSDRKLATIERIADVKMIPNADRICAYKVRDWWVVDQKHKYNIDDLAVFFEVDSFLPYELAPFLSKPDQAKTYQGVVGNRLRTVKLKKQISQGLILPLDILPETVEISQGLDVTEVLGIVKWEPPVSAQLAGNARGNFPSMCRKTDQPRAENFADEIFTEYKNAKWEVTLKLDGSSCSTYYHNGLVGVCSRNLDLKLDESNADNSFVKTATELGLLDAISQSKRNIQVSAELMGPGIQGNREKLSSHMLYVFDIFDIDTQRYLSVAERLQVFDQLVKLGFKGQHAPILAVDVTLEDLQIIDVDSSKVYVDRRSINNDIAEGCVFKTMDGQYSFKSINNKYLLRYDD